MLVLDFFGSEQFVVENGMMGNGSQHRAGSRAVSYIEVVVEVRENF